MRARLILAALVVAGLLLPAGCVTLPESGPVHDTTVQTQAPEEGGIPIKARPPRNGESKAEVIEGFLEAMQAYPVTTTVARQYLTSDYRLAWDPEREIITYGERSAPREATRGKAGDAGEGEFAVTLTDADHLDKRGRWQGPVSVGERTLSLKVVREGGQFRIDSAPDALVVPETWFEPRFTQVSLYFFDPTATILIPEPVFVPRGQQLATSLVRGLLRGPGQHPVGSLRSFFPPNLSAGLSIPVNRTTGLANVVLTGVATPPSDQDVERMTAQLVWTLRQVPDITEVGLGIGGSQLRLPGGRNQVSVDGSVAYDPVGYNTTDRLFGMQAGKLVSGTTPINLRPVAGPFGAKARQFSNVSVDLTGARAVGVTVDRTAMWLAPLASTRIQGDKTVPSRPRRLLRGATDLLRPSWDFARRLWIVDRTARGARVLVSAGGTPHAVVVPGVSGQDVRSFLVSHDGSRLVAVIRDDGTDKVVVSRILHDPSGAVAALSRAVRISTTDVDDRIQDIGWSSPTTVLLLSRLGDTAQVRTISVNGAPIGSGGLSVTVRGVGARLVTSPAPANTDTPYVLTSDGSLAKLTSPEAVPVAVAQGLTSLWYAG